jgi:hypothetical protein
MRHLNDLSNVSSRSTARAAARLVAEIDCYERIREAGRNALQTGRNIAAAERRCAADLAAAPGAAAEAWLNSGAGRILGLPRQWEDVFAYEYERALARAARHFLTEVSPE